jgi:hypothetical protein
MSNACGLAAISPVNPRRQTRHATRATLRLPEEAVRGIVHDELDSGGPDPIDDPVRCVQVADGERCGVGGTDQPTPQRVASSRHRVQ